MRRTIRLTERDLSRIVKRVIREDKEIIPQDDRLKNAQADLADHFLQAGISTPSGCNAPETLSDVGDCYIAVGKLIINGNIEPKISNEFLTNIGMNCGDIISIIDETSLENYITNNFD